MKFKAISEKMGRFLGDILCVVYTKKKFAVTELCCCVATEFAELMGFPHANLSTPYSLTQWLRWKNESCQPNYWKVRNHLRLHIDVMLPCPRKKEASSFSTISLAFLDRFS